MNTKSFITLVLAISSACAQADSYTLTEIKTGPLDFSTAMALNNKGVVVAGPEWGFKKYIYQNGTAKPLAINTTRRTEIVAINDHKVVLGLERDLATDPTPGFIFDANSNTLEWLPVFGDKTAHSFGLDINAHGRVAGVVASANGDSAAFSYYKGDITPLGTLGGTSSVALGINDSGIIVGRSDLAGDEVEHAYVYKNGVMNDLGALGGDFSQAVDINNAGTIIGSYTSVDHGENMLGFMYSNGKMTRLGKLRDMSYCFPVAINDAGKIVGECRREDDSENDITLFIYSDGKLANLSAMLAGSEWTLTRVKDINNRGEIIGDARRKGDDDSVRRAVLLTPKKYSSKHPKMNYRGTTNGWGWGNGAMSLVGNHLWQIDVDVKSSVNQSFKLDVDGTWATNFGDNNGDNRADLGGKNIPFNKGSGKYRIEFNDSTRKYSVIKLR